MKDIIKTKQINKLTKKFPMWNKIFINWMSIDKDLDLNQLEIGFTTLIKYKHLLSNDINMNTMAILSKETLNSSISISEHFNDSVQSSLQLKLKNNFIKSLKTKSYKHLFTEENESEIGVILDNNITIHALKHQLFNKLARYKNPEELFGALTEFKKQNIHWNYEHYANKVKSLNASIVDYSNDVLTIEVHDFDACKNLGPQSWCITQNDRTFKSYTEDLLRQFIVYNFNLPIEDNQSIIGNTLFFNGDIRNSHLKNDHLTPNDIKKNMKTPVMSEKRILTEIRSHNNDHMKQIELLTSVGKTDFFERYNEFKDASNTFLENLEHGYDFESITRLIRVAITANNIKIIDIIFKDYNIEIGNNYDQDDLIFDLSKSFNLLRFDIFKSILNNQHADPSYGHDKLIKNIYNTYKRYDNENDERAMVCKKFFDLLIKDKRINPNFLIDYDFIKFVNYSNISITSDIEFRNKLSNPKLNPFAYNNEAIKSSFLPDREEIFNILFRSKKITDNLDIYSILSSPHVTPTKFKKLFNIDNETITYTQFNKALDKIYINHSPKCIDGFPVFELILSQKTFKNQPKETLHAAIDKLFNRTHNLYLMLTLMNQGLYPTKSVQKRKIHSLFEIMTSTKPEVQSHINNNYWKKILKISPDITRTLAHKTIEHLSRSNDFQAIKILCNDKNILKGVLDYYEKNSCYNGGFSDSYYRTLGLKPTYNDNINPKHRDFILKKCKNAYKTSNFFGP